MRRLLLLPILLVCSAAQAQIRYHLTDLGTMDQVQSEATGVNNLGEVVGSVFSANRQIEYAFLYSGGVMRNLGTLGGTQSWAVGINDSGQVAGTSYTSDGEPHPFIYTVTAGMQDLGALPGADAAAANAINASGQVVGQSREYGGNYVTFLYSDGEMEDLGTLPGGVESSGFGINAAGQVVGFSNTTVQQPVPMIYANGVMQALTPFYGFAYGINDFGTAVGTYEPRDVIAGTSEEAFSFDGLIKPLGTLGGRHEASYAYAINRLGSIVGSSTIHSQTDAHAFIYTNGKMYDINLLMDYSGIGYEVVSATAINDRGWIAGYGYAPSSGLNFHAFLLTPISAIHG